MRGEACSQGRLHTVLLSVWFSQATARWGTIRGHFGSSHSLLAPALVFISLRLLRERLHYPSHVVAEP